MSSATLVALKKSGLSYRNAETMLRIGYMPQPKQMLFHAAAFTAGYGDIGYGGARGGGKTAATFVQAVLFAITTPGLKILFLRKTGKAAKESIDDLRKRFLSRVKHGYSRVTREITFANDARIIIGYFASADDADQYQGQAYGLIIVEEATQLPWMTIDLLSGSLRTDIPGWQPKFIMTANPGGIGHGWFKAKFIGTKNFVFATYRDNVYLDPGYTERLAALRGRLGEMWRDGNWDIPAGQFYDTFRAANKITESESLNYIRAADECVLSHDWGNAHPAATLLWARCGETWVIAHEWRHRKTPPGELARSVISGCAALGVDATKIDMYCGGDVFANRVAGQSTISAMYIDCGLSPIAVRVGVTESAQLALSMFSSGQLRVSERCTNLIEQLETIAIDDRNSERPQKTNADDDGRGGDDFADAMRYGLPIKTGVMVW